MKIKLTNTVLSKFFCPEGKQKDFISDTEVSGLKVRVTANGAKSFVFEKRPKGSGRLKTETLGRVGDITIEFARSLARKKAIDYEDRDYLFRLAKENTRQSFGEVFQQYKSIRMTLLAESTQQKQIGLFTREVLPSLKDFPIDTVTRALVSTITLKIQGTGREGTAQDVWKAVSAFLTWCVQQGYIETNPILGATPQFKINKRERFLSIPEITNIWHATENINPIRRSAIRLMILMPFRKSEFTACIWDDYHNGCIKIPASRSKNNRAISLPLSDFGRKLLPPRRNDTDFIFSTNGNVPTRLDDKLLKRVTAASGVTKFGWHDFRRTFSTHLQEAPNADYIAIDACLNHVTDAQKGVAGVYNRANYADRMYAVMMQWSDIIEGAVNDG